MRADRESSKLTQRQMYRKLFNLAYKHCLRKSDSRDTANRTANIFASGSTVQMWRNQYEK